jgi:hypothetical protein
MARASWVAVQATFRRRTVKSLDDLLVEMTAAGAKAVLEDLLGKAKGPAFVSELVTTITTMATKAARAGERKQLASLIENACKISPEVRDAPRHCAFSVPPCCR